MPRENKTQYPILGFLSRREMSGYDIQKLSKRTNSYYWSECNPQVYGTLKKLEKDELVSSRIDEDSGARNRRVYAITKKGMEFYKSWLESPTKCAVYRDELMLKIANGQHLSKEKLLKHLHDEQLRIEMQLSELKDVQDHIKKDHAGKEDQPFLTSVYSYAEINLRTKLEWMKQTIVEFK
jgi:PadR family transcriptional regulator AphA